MRKVILQLRLDPANASVDRVRKELKLRPGQIDSGFGVANVRSKDNIYAVKVDADVAARVRGDRGKYARSLPDTRISLVH